MRYKGQVHIGFGPSFNVPGMGTNPSVSLGYEFFGLDHLKILNDPRYTFDYNLEGQTTAEALFNSSDVKTGEFTYTYDAMGWLDILIPWLIR